MAINRLDDWLDRDDDNDLASDGDDMPEPQSHQQQSMTGVYVMLWLILLFSVGNLVLRQVDNSSIRRELDDNAELIRGLQQRQIIKDLLGVRKADK